MTTTTTAGYLGWLRIGRGPWRPVVGDVGKDDCLALLMAHADGVRAPHKDLAVLPAGTDPNDPIRLGQGGVR
jgi:hypothetical protein